MNYIYEGCSMNKNLKYRDMIVKFIYEGCPREWSQGAGGKK